MSNLKVSRVCKLTEYLYMLKVSFLGALSFKDVVLLFIIYKTLLKFITLGKSVLFFTVEAIEDRRIPNQYPLELGIPFIK